MRVTALCNLRLPGRAVAALRRRRRAVRPRRKRLYAGHRGDRVEVQVVSRNGIAPLRPPRRHSGVSFDWGTTSTGAEALADALLADATRRRHSAADVRELAAGPLAALPREGFVLEAEELCRWSARAQQRHGERHAAAADDATGPRR
jgi:hypothetical protein